MTGRIIFCGPRDFTDEALVREFFDGYVEAGSLVVHGACPTGADALVDAEATRRSISIERHPAEWKRHPPHAAGPIRNAQMVALGATACVAFVDGMARVFGPYRKTRGTADMLRKSVHAGIHTVIVARVGTRMVILIRGKEHA